MTEALLIKLSIVILFLPLIGFIVTLFFAKKVKKVYLFEIVIIIATFILSVVLLYSKLAYYQNQNITSEFEWINLGIGPIMGKVTVDLGLFLDNVTVIMMFVVALISMLVHIFSIGYMEGDKRFNRYFAYLGIFTFSMSGIVLTHNVLMMYIFWELVGLSSYLLIGFWYEKKSASDAAKKAFIVNRIGDIRNVCGNTYSFYNISHFYFSDCFSPDITGNSSL